MFIILFIILMPFRAAYSIKRDNPYGGNLYLDPLSYNSKMKAFRISTLMNQPWQNDFFSTQVSINGFESFEGGGTSFYNKNDAKLWNDIVAVGAPSWEKLGFEFINWNNRIELIKEDFEAKDKIFQLMKLNNVVFIRSLEPIDYPEIELIETKNINIKTLKSIILFEETKKQTHYLYTIKKPISRVFSIPEKSLKINNITHDDENDEMKNLNFIIDDITNINLDEYYSGLIRFSGNFNTNHKLLSSTNFSNRWKLYINNKLNEKNLSSGPLGMIQIQPVKGYASYELHFESYYQQIIMCMLISILLYVLLSIYIQNNFNLTKND